VSGSNGVDDESRAGDGITRCKHTRAGCGVTVAADDIDLAARGQIDTGIFRDKTQAGVLTGGEDNDVGVQYLAGVFLDNRHFTAFFIEFKLLKFLGLNTPDLAIAVIDDVQKIQTAIEFYTLFCCRFDFMLAGGNTFIQFPHGHTDAGGAKTYRCARHVHRNITPADDHDTLTLDRFCRVREVLRFPCFLLVLPQAHVTQEVGIDHHAVQVVSGEWNPIALVGADCDQYGVETFIEKVVQSRDLHVEPEVDTEVDDILYFPFYHRYRQAVFGYANTQHTASDRQ